MSEEYQQTSTEPEVVLTEIVLTPFENVIDQIGTITKAEQRVGGGHVFGELTISYVNGNEEERAVTAGIYLGEEGKLKEMANSTKEVLIMLRDATGSPTISGTVGSRVKFSAKQQKKRPSQGNFTKFSLPA